MKLSTLSRYGFRAMIELAKHGEESLSLKKIAEAQNIPFRYLENIMARLVNAKIVMSMRGRGGGFRLIKKPEEITVYEIVDALEGTLSPLPCIDSPLSCERFSECGARDFIKEAYGAFITVLKSRTLKEATQIEVSRQLKIEKNGGIQ